MHAPLALLALASSASAQFTPSPGNFPATGDDSVAGGIFSISLADVVPFFTKYPSTATGTESPKTAGGVGFLFLRSFLSQNAQNARLACLTHVVTTIHICIRE
jgi:hypothetical protein